MCFNLMCHMSILKVKSESSEIEKTQKKLLKKPLPMLGWQVMKQFHIVHYTRLYVFYQLILVLARYLYRFGGDGSPVSHFRNQSYFEPSRTILTLRTEMIMKNVQILLKTCIPKVWIKNLIQSLRSFQYYLTIFFFLIFPSSSSPFVS